MANSLGKSILYTAMTVLSLAMTPVLAMAQNMVHGTVFDTDRSNPLTGATVIVEGKKANAVTDLDGKFTIRADKGDVLIVQFMGYVDGKVTVTGSANYEIVLTPDSEQLNEVIVTALGITREKRSLGYAATDVSGESLTSVQNSNWLTNLQGKVAGLTFNSASSGPINSQRVVVRGESSLNSDASALYVIDGVPVTSGTVANASGSTYTNDAQDNPIDFGDAASDLNPDDIESITVLKGAAATALYGSRAGNGAIIITTKSGRTTKGLGVTYSTSFTADVPSYWPDFQTEYGAGSDLGVNPYNYWPAEYNPDGLSANNSRYAWGEAYGDGTKMRYQYVGMNWDTLMGEKTPWQYRDDWFTGIFQTGYTFDNVLTIEGNTGKGTSVRFSVKDSRNKWILPNTGYTKQTFSFSVNSKLNKTLKLTAKVNYYRTDSDNMPSSAYNNNSIMYILQWMRNNDSMQNYRDEYFGGRLTPEVLAGGNLFANRSDGVAYNPYRTLYEMTNSMDKDRVFGNIGVTVNLWKEKLTFELKSGMDLDHQFRTQRKPWYSYKFLQGWYREQTINICEFNTNWMLKYTDAFFDERLTLTAGLGGNNMTYNANNFKYTIDKLDIEGLYMTSNYPAGTIPDVSTSRSNKVVNSIYGLVSLGWEDWAYLDVTFRNDWSSTLARGYWSYFYPSVSGSLILDKLFNFKDNLPWVSFLKLRASWANVGKDTSPYSLDYNYTTTNFAGGYRVGATMPKIDLAPENVNTTELGLEVKFLKNRIGIDAAIYQSDITNQIYDVPYDYITGAKYYTQNIGLIRNRGIELSVNFVPVKTRDITWEISANAARNVGVLKRMYDGWDNENPHQENYSTGIGGRFQVLDYVGKRMGEIWAKEVYRRAPEGAFYLDENGNQVDCSGAMLLDAASGLPQDSGEFRYYGNANPDWVGGLATSFRWKDLTVSAAFSAQIGGMTYSVSAGILGYQGKLKNTLEGRYDSIVAPGVNEIKDTEGNVTYQKNQTLCSDIYKYYNTYKANRYCLDEYCYDTSYLKMKELRVEYNFPKTLIAKTRILQGISVAAYATNLFCVSKYPFFDPDCGTIDGSTIKRGLETGSFPMNRSYGINLKVRF
ncbi:MAG: SusC/RagA family TonB-linked outer membrane protein [Bacteroidales bacterium]|nr:SusC/RagA family TonB-linked outer membrane protein [Bacteroidales bacterium]